MGDAAPELRQPCAVCGTTARALNASATFAGTGHLYNKTRALHRDGGSKVVREVTIGDDYTRKTGRWSQYYRLIDRGNNRYEEIVRDGETGAIIHQTAEPLTNHSHVPKPSRSH
jgi:hypothetical protein